MIFGQYAFVFYVMCGERYLSSELGLTMMTSHPPVMHCGAVMWALGMVTMVTSR